MLPKALRAPALVAASLLVGGFLVACTADTYQRRADRAAREILERGTEEVLGHRRETVEMPVMTVPGVDEPREPAEERNEAAAEEVARRVLSLGEALELAVEGNREYKSNQEALYLQALSLASVRHSFDPQLALSLSYLFVDQPDLPTSEGAGFDASLDQILPWGGSLQLGAGTDWNQLDSDGEFSTRSRIALIQPLLRGAGRAVSHEPLVQAERNLVYAVRDFELYRESFSIDVARRYYDLVQRKQSVDNLAKNLEGFVFGRRQAEALFAVGRTNELDVLRARRSELNSQDSLISAQEDLLLALDRFRIFLGLPETEPVDVEGEAPAFVPTNLAVDEAIRVAMVNRLDVLNRTEQLEDVARGVWLAADALQPDLDLSAGFNVTAGPDSSFTQQVVGRGALTAGVTLGLPVDRVRESNSYRASQIAEARAKRSFEEFKDNLRVEIISAFRELERRRLSLDIQRELIADQEKNVKIARLRFEQGQFSNRDVVEAEESLLDARNSLINEQVNYEIARLQLLRDLGILFIDEKGMWNE